MPQIRDQDGNVVQGSWEQYGVGQAVSYTGTPGALGQPFGTTQATAVITGVTVPNDADTIVIGDKTYTFKTTLTGGGTGHEGEVLINSTLDAALLNLIRAINHSGSAGTDYDCAAAHDQVSAGASVGSGHKVTLTQLIGSDAGNAYALTPDGVRLTVGSAFAGGVSDRGVRLVLAMLTTAGYVKTGPSPTATTSSIPMGAGLPRVFQVNAGDGMSAVQAASGGSLTAVELL